MDQDLRRRLRARRGAIRRKWEELLRAGPVVTPLGHPDVLAHLINRTLNVVFGSLGAPGLGRRARQSGRLQGIGARCLCGRNPLLAYYLAGERALREALDQASAEAPGLAPEARDQAACELGFIVEDIGRRDVELFCSLCLYREEGGRVSPASNPVARTAVAARAKAPHRKRRCAAGDRLTRRPFQTSGITPSLAPRWP